MTGEQALRQQIPESSLEESVEGRIISASEDLDRFAVLALRLDGLREKQEELDEDSQKNASSHLAKILGGMGKTKPIIWAPLGQEHFAVLCPDVDEGKAIIFAKEIQRRFSLNTKKTVSIGLAVYPFWPFEKDTILANARKAIDHAAFFGANTVTPFDSVSLNISADNIYQYGDMDGAIEEFRKALMVDVDNANAHNSLGVCYGVQGKFDQAIGSFQAALKLNPDDVMATYNLGLAHLKKGDRDQALALFLTAYELDKDHPDIACHIGMCYRDMGNTEAALTYLENGAQKGPKGPHLFKTLAECYLQVGRLREACRAYSNAIKRHPTDAKSLNALGHLYGKMGENLDVAIVLARESTTIEPGNGLFRKRLAELYLMAGRHKKAIAELEEAEKLGEDVGLLLAKAKTYASISTSQPKVK